jgi:hypothetical protein
MIPPEIREALPEGSTVEVLWADLLLWQARRYTADQGVWWSKTRLPILRAFHLTPDEYEQLTVSDHAEMAAHLGLKETAHAGG